MFIPKDIKHEREIKAVLDYQLVNLRTYNLDPRAPAQDMAGLQSTYGDDKSEITKANEMLKTGQVPIDVNSMPGLVEDMSDAEELDAETLECTRQRKEVLGKGERIKFYLDVWITDLK